MTTSKSLLEAIAHLNYLRIINRIIKAFLLNTTSIVHINKLNVKHWFKCDVFPLFKVA